MNDVCQSPPKISPDDLDGTIFHTIKETLRTKLPEYQFSADKNMVQLTHSNREWVAGGWQGTRRVNIHWEPPGLRVTGHWDDAFSTKYFGPELRLPNADLLYTDVSVPDYDVEQLHDIIAAVHRYLGLPIKAPEPMTSHQFAWMVIAVNVVFIGVAGAGFGRSPAEAILMMFFLPGLFLIGIAFGILLCFCRASCERIYPNRYKRKLWTHSLHTSSEQPK
jgi:hypothetical protein